MVVYSESGGLVLCQICYLWVTRNLLNPVADGWVEDVCIECAQREKELVDES